MKTMRSKKDAVAYMTYLMETHKDINLHVIQGGASWNNTQVLSSVQSTDIGRLSTLSWAYGIDVMNLGDKK